MVTNKPPEPSPEQLAGWWAAALWREPGLAHATIGRLAYAAGWQAPVAGQFPGATKMVPPPAEGEVEELVGKLRWIAAQCADIGWPDDSVTVDRAAALLERQAAPVPVAVSDALIKAECALSDIAEGEAMADEGDPLQWAERRCADALAIIRPTMKQHKIRTSEWPSVTAHALPLPSGEGVND